MSHPTFVRAIFSIALFAACTPIAPSVHKSTLRQGGGIVSGPKQEQQRDQGSLPIEVRWMESDRQLNAALETDPSSLVIRLSKSSVERLRSDGVLAVELPSEVAGRAIERTQILLRVQLEGESLEQNLTDHPWFFGWDEARPHTLEIRSAAPTKERDAVTVHESLVSVHIVLQPAQ